VAATSASQPAGGFRPDIQGLRAIAVLLVLVYHLVPRALPGGYVGVDVFFVISGYLITSLLLKDREETGSISFTRFYVRRARRLLPASLVTLAAILVAAYLLLPPLVWRDTAQEAAASALYVENWWLAAESVDYLALDSVASTTQHFWSLSVEEQFYLGWPLLLFLVSLAGRALKVDVRRAWVATLLVVVASSLAWSIHLGLTGAPTAYFSTFTRVWQLASGGLLAVLGVRAGREALPCLIAGLVAIFAAGLVLADSTSYPGYAALLPTGGAVLALHGGPSHASSLLTRWLALRPVQLIGDISYSLYLWHWPIIAIHGYRTGAEPGPLAAVLIFAGSIALAALSKRLVEDPFRGPRRRPARVVFASAAAATAACVALAFALRSHADSAGDRGPLASADYPGAAALTGAPVPLRDFAPRLVDVEDDVASAYDQGCVQQILRPAVQTCVYGPRGAALRIALIGDSHAIHWLPALEALIERMELQVVAVTKTTCLFSLVPPYHGKLKRTYTECSDWTQNVIDYLAGERFDLVLVAASPNHVAGAEMSALDSQGGLAPGVRRALDAVARGGHRLVVLRATPWQRRNPRDCVAVESPPYQECAAPRAKAFWRDALLIAAEAGGHPVVDLSDLFCPGERCPPIIGNVFVYRDAHHITATYMRTLAPMLAERLAVHLPALAGGRR
jgi:peptidoglycan/LPS O-acetylase OafA/YrhL